jgi:hypothetical protein
MLKFAVHHLRLLSEPRRRHTSKTKSDTSASVCLYSKSIRWARRSAFRTRRRRSAHGMWRRTTVARTVGRLRISTASQRRWSRNCRSNYLATSLSAFCNCNERSRGQQNDEQEYDKASHLSHFRLRVPLRRLFLRSSWKEAGYQPVKFRPHDCLHVTSSTYNLCSHAYDLMHDES